MFCRSLLSGKNTGSQMLINLSTSNSYSWSPMPIQRHSSSNTCPLNFMQCFVKYPCLRSMLQPLSGESPNIVVDYMIQLGIFLIKINFSVWCWIVLSLHRYVAVFHPCRFRERAWYIRPMNSLCLILFLSVTVSNTKFFPNYFF